MNGCRNCRWCKCYKGDYWTPDEYECLKADDMDEDVFTEAWENDNTDVCPFAEEEEPEKDYWDEYAYKERYKK